MPTKKVWEPGELTEEQRKTVQLSQADQLTMDSHLRSKLRMGREKLAATWGTKAGADDDMQILARDMKIIFATPEAMVAAQNGKQLPAQPVVSAATTATTVAEPKKQWPAWALPAAIAIGSLGLGAGGASLLLHNPTPAAVSDIDSQALKYHYGIEVHDK